MNNRTFAYLLKDVLCIDMNDLNDYLNENCVSTIKRTDTFITVSGITESSLNESLTNYIEGAISIQCDEKKLSDDENYDRNIVLNNIDVFFDITNDDENIIIEKVDE